MKVNIAVAVVDGELYLTTSDAAQDRAQCRFTFVSLSLGAWYPFILLHHQYENNRTGLIMSSVIIQTSSSCENIAISKIAAFRWLSKNSQDFNFCINCKSKSICHLIWDLNLNLFQVPDARRAISLVSNPMYHERTKVISTFDEDVDFSMHVSDHDH